MSRVDRPTRLHMGRTVDATAAPRATVRFSGRARRPRNKRVVVTELATDRDHIDPLLEEKVDEDDYNARASWLNRVMEAVNTTSPTALNDYAFFETISSRLASLLHREALSPVRAACYRIVRQCFHSEKNLIHMLTVDHVDMFVVRALDLRSENEAERSEALRLIAAMLRVYASTNLRKLIQHNAVSGTHNYAFPKSVMQPVIAIALNALLEGGGERGEEESVDYADRLALPCISLFLEWAVVEADHVLEMAGTDWMVKVLTGNAAVAPRISQLVCRILVAWLDDEKMRQKAHLHLVLEQIFAPLIEFGFFQEGTEGGGGEKEPCLQLSPSTLSVFARSFSSLLSSWSGLLACAAPASQGISGEETSPLRLLEFLGVGTVENANLERIRDVIVELTCGLLDTPYQGRKFEEWQEAVEFYRTSHLPDAYQCSLREDFVLAELDMRDREEGGMDPPTSIDLLATFRALAMYILINAGLAQSLARLIIARPDEPNSLKATLLLSDVLFSSASVLPVEWRERVLSLPTLFHSACETIAHSQAAAAVDGTWEAPLGCDDRFTFKHAEQAQLVLHRLDQLTRVRAARADCQPPHTHVFLREGGGDRQTARVRVSDSQLLDLCEEAIEDGDEIDWPSCASALSHLAADTDTALRMRHTDNVHDMFKKIFSYLSPDSERYQDWQDDPAPVAVCKTAVRIAAQIAEEEPYYYERVNGLVTEMTREMRGDRLSSGVFCVRALQFCGSQYYFAIIGELSATTVGGEAMGRSGMIHAMVELMSSPSTPVEYVKLCSACLDYSPHNPLQRVVLETALKSTAEPCRVWCTRLLAHLLTSDEEGDKAGVATGEWAARLLIGQLGDPSNKVVRHAIRLLHEYLPRLPQLGSLLWRLPLDKFGDAGVLLRAHAFRCEHVVVQQYEEASKHVDMWMQWFNGRYAECCEEWMREGVTDARRSPDGGFARASGDRRRVPSVRAPVHLLASIASHHTGCELLRAKRVLPLLLDQLRQPVDAGSAAEVKGALMAVAAMGSTDSGMRLVSSEAVALLCRRAEESSMLSVRGCAFWALSTISLSHAGSVAIARFGWESVTYSDAVKEARDDLAREAHAREHRTRTSRTSTSNDTANTPLIFVHRTQSSRRLSRVRSLSVCMEGEVKKDTRLRRSASEQCLVMEEEDIDEEKSESSRSREFTFSSVDEASGGGGAGVGGAGRRTTRDSLGGGADTETTEGRSRSSTVQQCLAFGLDATKQQLIKHRNAWLADAVPETHFSSRNRVRARLQPLHLPRILQVSRSVSEPINYVFMSASELSTLSSWRVVCLREEGSSPFTQPLPLARQPAASIVADWPHSFEGGVAGVGGAWVHAALPAHANVVCEGIFPKADVMSSLLGGGGEEVDSRGMKSGHGRVRATEYKPHSTYRCFHCSNEQKPPSAPLPAGAAELRLQVLELVDLLEIKHALPEKKLLRLAVRHRWLFSWQCLYADVLELLDEYRFSAQSRTFLHELFYDALQL